MPRECLDLRGAILEIAHYNVAPLPLSRRHLENLPNQTAEFPFLGQHAFIGGKSKVKRCRVIKVHRIALLTISERSLASYVAAAHRKKRTERYRSGDPPPLKWCDLTLDKLILQEAAGGTTEPRTPPGLHRADQRGYAVSKRRACAAFGQHRSTQPKVPRGRPDEEGL